MHYIQFSSSTALNYIIVAIRTLHLFISNDVVLQA
jgi:hypothetical protein